MKSVQEVGQTLGLAMIMKDEVDDLKRIVKDYTPFFDRLYITVTERKTYTTLRNLLADNPTTFRLVELSYFKWIDHFGKARRYNQTQVKTDYWMWLDLDDEIEGGENLPKVITYMVANKLDAVWFKYDCIRQVTASDPQSISWRERIIRTASKLEWRDDACHETINIQKKDIRQKLLPDLVIKHRKTYEQTLASSSRNRRIMEKDWQQTHSAVTASYQGVDLILSGDYEGAITKFSYVIEHGKSKELRFEAWGGLCECYFQTKQYILALGATNEAININADHPEPWYQRFVVYLAMGDFNRAMRSAEVAMSKRVQGKWIIQAQDPSRYQYKIVFTIAQAYLTIGNIERAYQLYNEVKKIAPQYIEEQSTAEVRWGAVFERAYHDKRIAAKTR